MATEGQAVNNETPQDRLSRLTKLGSAKESIRDYSAAADLYSEASEIQAELNGDMAVENADILYSYGKCLYHVGVDKSEVLGTKMVAQGTNLDQSEPSSSKQPDILSSGLIGDAIAKSMKEAESLKNGKSADTNGKTAAGNGLFQFNHDGESDDSDEENDEPNGETAGEEEEDEFSNAFEILDLSRVLYDRKLESLVEKEANADEIRRIKGRLAEIYDLQAEISLEGEKFKEAASDLMSSLAIKEELYSLQDPIIAECHYKLSLALEFSAITRSGEDQVVTDVDSASREEAAKHMEIAIKSCRERISIEQRRVDTSSTDEDEELARIKRNIDDVKEMVSDMEQRLVDLRLPPVVIPAAEKVEEAPAVNLEELTKVANDLSGLVKKKKPTIEEEKGAGKRVLESTDTADSSEPKAKQPKQM